MKVAQFRAILEAAERLYADNGNSAAAQSLREISLLFAGRDAMTVSSFSNMITKLFAVADDSKRI